MKGYLNKIITNEADIDYLSEAEMKKFESDYFNDVLREIEGYYSSEIR